MSATSGLVKLVTEVRAYFVENAVSAEVAALGWREYRKLPTAAPGNTNRVVFLPSNEAGKGGRFSAQARNIGNNPRAVATIERDLVVSVWAVDATTQAAVASDIAQIEAVEKLLESTVQAVRSFAHADASWGSFEWTLSPLEHAYGRELRVELRYRGPLLWPKNNTRIPAVGGIAKTLPRNLP